ncbi:MAG: thiamine pyrophosphate-dependent dehydrogenase E1 component subunit alpha, partial [Eubacteriales bacterium]|nr:thiamine pyrophosphate-dependent dehydrogenase E1 component subunit alpha [Eubacteriales bacterium]
MLSNKNLKEIYKNMSRMRCFEEAASRLYKEGLVTGSLHPYIGEEAIGATAMQLMKKGDMFTSTHRGLGHCVACGMDINAMMAELFGKATGIGGGKGGSMHMFDLEKGNLGTNGIVAGGTSIAVGAALTAKELKKTDAVVFCFFGEGASNEGVIHESMNLAAVWKIPVIFVCENNLYEVFTTAKESCSVQDISARAAGYGMLGETVDGNDVLGIEPAYRAAIKRARAGEGPSLIECKTYRWSGHWPGDVYSYGGYRTTEEVDEWKEKCPIKRLSRYLV